MEPGRSGSLVPVVIRPGKILPKMTDLEELVLPGVEQDPRAHYIDRRGRSCRRADARRADAGGPAALGSDDAALLYRMGHRAGRGD